MTPGDPCRFLEWDSNHFRCRIARVEAHRLTPEELIRIDGWRRDHAINCLYFLADPTDSTTLALAEGAGFARIDVRVTLDCALTLPPADSPGAEGPSIRRFESGDLPRLRRIARESHTETRFFRDSRFDRARSADLYETWISKSCGGDAGAVFVAVGSDGAAGYVTCSLEPPGAGRIGLLAVAAEERGKGLGRGLVRESLRWFGRNAVKRVSVATQGTNQSARRLYLDSGFLVSSEQIWYHRWSPPSGTER